MIEWPSVLFFTRGSKPLKEATMTNRRIPIRMICALALPAILAGPVVAHEVPDPSIVHNARDGLVRLYGAGGPDTAFKKVAEVFTKETGIKVVITGGPEPTWTKEAQADADILWGTAEEDITALLETYKDFTWDDVTPIYLRPAIIAVKKGNPKHIRGFDDLLKPGMRIVVTEGARADQVLYSGVACITDLVVKEGLINLDFADVRAIMREMARR
jgi:accessory colonization factor AcfC